MSTVDVGRLYFEVVHGYQEKRVSRAWTTEVPNDPEEDDFRVAPYRVGRGFAVKLTWRRIFVVGWWKDAAWDGDDATVAALNASSLYYAPEEIGEWGSSQVPSGDS